MTEWDNDRQRGFWEACGFEVIKRIWLGETIHRTQWVHGKGCDSIILPELPDIHDLNALFKYAVPEALKTYKVAMFSEPKGYSVYFFRDSDACSKTAAFDPNPALALAEAIEKVIVK